ncbi:hypothetical protein KUA24_50 [Vibrio phage HNL01]|nr:hypothetical protein KUA24_50 [Vibrio phage HNL01]
MYDWSYKEFVPLEFYVNFNEDRKVWAERDAKRQQGNKPPQ